MKVLVIIPGLGGGGGSERSLLESTPGLRREGIELVVAYFVERPSSIREQFEDAGARFVKVDARHVPGRVKELRRIIRRERPAVVHTILFEADLCGRLAAIGTGVRVMNSFVSSSHDPERRSDPSYSSWRVGLVRRFEGFSARHLQHHAHANSETTKASAVRNLGVRPADITVVSRSRDPGRLGEPGPERRAAVRRSLDLADDRPVLVTVGRHEYQKGQLDLVAALPAIRARVPDTVLLVAGRHGAMSERLAGLIASEGLGDAVRLLGPVDVVPDLLAAADLFAFPSVLEGSPGAVIEAMALALPIVACDISAVRELTADCAVLVAPHSPSQLAAAIGDLLLDADAARELGGRARRRYLERFTGEDTARDMAALYRRVARGS